MVINYGDIRSYLPIIKFGRSLSSVTMHGFLSFMEVNMSRRNQFDLTDIDWKQLLENSKQKRFPLSNRPVTDNGKPLIEVCIDMCPY